jgi:hypothetical protein
MGYVWEQDGRIVGNASLIPFRHRGQRIYLIANVAAHPDYRRRGIGRALTERVMKQARNKRATAIWLQVRDDNPGAIKLYQELGFQEIARRTTWQAGPDSRLGDPQTDVRIVSRHPRFWLLQQEWLRRLYPEALRWYHSWNIDAFRPGLLNSIYLLLIDSNIRQWAAVRNDELLATLTWMPQAGRSESLYVAIPASLQGQAQFEAVTSLLIQARRTVTYYSYLTLEYPAGEMTESIRRAGFTPRRTLLWMRA